MIVFDLSCAAGHRFEGWFGSSDDFSSQCVRGLVSCPQCGSLDVTKAPMAPAVPMKGNRITPTRPAPIREKYGQPAAVSNGTLPPEVLKAMTKLAEIQTQALKESKWVGREFAEKSRAMHYGEQDSEAIHGEATPEEAKGLKEEGIAVAPLPFPVAPPEDLN